MTNEPAVYVHDDELAVDTDFPSTKIEGDWNRLVGQLFDQGVQVSEQPVREVGQVAYYGLSPR